MIHFKIGSLLETDNGFKLVEHITTTDSFNNNRILLISTNQVSNTDYIFVTSDTEGTNISGESVTNYQLALSETQIRIKKKFSCNKTLVTAHINLD